MLLKVVYSLIIDKSYNTSFDFSATGITDVENQVKWNSTGPSST